MTYTVSSGTLNPTQLNLLIIERFQTLVLMLYVFFVYLLFAYYNTKKMQWTVEDKVTYSIIRSIV